MQHELRTDHVYESRPFWKRPAFYSTTLMLLLVWAIDLTMVAFAYNGLFTANQFRQLAGIVLFCAVAFAVYLVWFTINFATRAFAHYAVSVGHGAVTLFVESPFMRNVQATVRPAEIDYLEHFTATDRETLVCHLKNGRLVEIPLWALPDSARAITALLKSADVQVLTI